MSEGWVKLAELRMGQTFQTAEGDLGVVVRSRAGGQVFFTQIGSGQEWQASGALEVRPIDLPRLLREHAEMTRLVDAARDDAVVWEERGRALEREALRRHVLGQAAEERAGMERAPSYASDYRHLAEAYEGVAKWLDANGPAPVLLPLDHANAEAARLRAALKTCEEAMDAAGTHLAFMANAKSHAVVKLLDDAAGVVEKALKRAD